MTSHQSTVNDSSVQMATAVTRIGDCIIQGYKRKSEIAKRQLDLQESTFNWEMAKEIFGSSSDALELEKVEMRRLMRKRVLSALIGEERSEYSNGHVRKISVYAPTIYMIQ